MTETEALVILNAIPGLTALRIRRLVEHFGSAARLFSLQTADFMQTGIIPGTCVANINNFDRERFLEQELRLIAKHNIDVITLDDIAYPANLKEITDAPAVLYVRGSLLKTDTLSLAVVGSRLASVYGMTTAGEFAGALSELGFTVVSGMARGIDTSAHQGCLRSKGRTLAVLGCGLSNIYPPENDKLMEMIAANGAVVSEFPMTTPPMAKNFPQRNRVISGISLGVLVIEASKQSGALITSRFALEQGREVFALPGRVKDPNASGTHRLIQQGAKLVTCIEDILEELHPRVKALVGVGQTSASIKEARPKSADDVSQDEAQVLGCLDNNPVFIDDLLTRLERPLAYIMNILLELEMKHMVKKSPGMFYSRVQQKEIYV